MTDEKKSLTDEEMRAVAFAHSDQLQRIEDCLLALRAELLALTLLVQNPFLRSTT